MNFKPAPYSNTDSVEADAINIFRSLINNKRVKEHINLRDKVPNYDGNIELVDESECHIGFLIVQIKKMNANDIINPKVTLKVEFFGFCKKTNVPVLLIGVDCSSKRAYWINCDKEYFQHLNLKLNQKTLRFHFLPENVIDGKNELYIKEWVKIIDNLKMKLNKFMRLEHKYDKLIEMNSINIIGCESEHIEKLHLFLDEFNSLIDSQFKGIKQILFPNTWKIGIMFIELSDGKYAYSFFPIASNCNDILIKKGKKALYDQMVENRLGIWLDDSEEMFKNPKKYALEQILDAFKSIIEDQMLNIQYSDSLQKELIISFIEKYSAKEGLKLKEIYSLDEINEYFSRTHQKILDGDFIRYFDDGQFDSFKSAIVNLIRDGTRKISRHFGSVPEKFLDNNLNEGLYSIIEDRINYVLNSLQIVFYDMINGDFSDLATILIPFTYSHIIFLYSIQISDMVGIKNITVILYQVQLKSDYDTTLEIETFRYSDPKVNSIRESMFKKGFQEVNWNNRKYRITSLREKRFDEILSTRPLFESFNWFLASIIEDFFNQYLEDGNYSGWSN